MQLRGAHLGLEEQDWGSAGYRRVPVVKAG